MADEQNGAIVLAGGGTAVTAGGDGPDSGGGDVAVAARVRAKRKAEIETAMRDRGHGSEYWKNGSTLPGEYMQLIREEQGKADDPAATTRDFIRPGWRGSVASFLSGPLGAAWEASGRDIPTALARTQDAVEDILASSASVDYAGAAALEAGFNRLSEPLQRACITELSFGSVSLYSVRAASPDAVAAFCALGIPAEQLMKSWGGKGPHYLAACAMRLRRIEAAVSPADFAEFSAWVDSLSNASFVATMMMLATGKIE